MKEKHFYEEIGLDDNGKLSLKTEYGELWIFPRYSYGEAYIHCRFKNWDYNLFKITRLAQGEWTKYFKEPEKAVEYFKELVEEFKL